MAQSDCLDLRIGTSVADLKYLRYRSIPEPDAWTFAPYSVVRTCGDGSRKGYGYPVCSWSWETMAQDQIAVLLGYFAADSDASVQVYISTYTDTGRARTTTDYTAYMQRPIDGEGRQMYPRALGKVDQNVTITFTHLEAA